MDTIPRCPACRRVDWYRDGFRVHEQDDGTIETGREAPASVLAGVWACRSCGWKAPIWGLLHARLNALQMRQAD